MDFETMVVYGLYDGAELVYVGVTRNPRVRMREHVLERIPFTRMEILSSRLPREGAASREQELLSTYKRKHGGRWPRFNERAA